jgi:phosphatidylserine/phosphatidylglycerophosphate/cardiolipin synthase-like enzyme
MSTFCNNILCDIYIGQGSGKKLLSDISNAQRSIRIVSPFISPDLLDILIRKYKRGINVQLISMFPQNNDSILGRMLINQTVTLNESAQLERQKLKKYYNILRYTQIAVILLFIIIFIFAVNIGYNTFVPIVLGVLFVLAIRRKRSSLNKKADRIRIFEYSYSEVLPFKIFVNRTIEDFFIHSKIFIIDDSIAYLGSLNFTWNGTKNSYESRVRTTDIIAISKIIEEFNDLFYSDKTCASIDFWGSRIYSEPIN